MIIVTGANGFIGSAMIWELNRAGYENIICVDPVNTEERPDNLKKLKYKHFFDKYEVFDFLKSTSAKIEGVFHIGACSSTTETNEEFLKENNTDYSKLFFNYCTQNKVPFIYASSAATYGNGDDGFSDTTSPKRLKPMNLYGWSKLNFDIWAEEQTETPPVWYGLKYFNVYGPNEYHKDNMSSVVLKAFHQISENGHLQLFKSHNPEYKDGEQLRDFVYIKDVTRWMLELFTEKKPPSGIYNMGSGQARSWLDLAKNVFKHLDKPVSVEWIDIPKNIREKYQYYTEAEMQNIMSKGLSPPQWDLEKGISDYVTNYLLKGELNL